MSPRTQDFVFTVQTLGHLYEMAMGGKPFVKQLWPMQVGIESIHINCQFRESMARIPKPGTEDTQVVHYLSPGICDVNVVLLHTERFNAKMWKCCGIMVKLHDRKEGSYFKFKPLSLERTNQFEGENLCELKNLFGSVGAALESSVVSTNSNKRKS